jgi:nucleoside phosphorylase
MKIGLIAEVKWEVQEICCRLKLKPVETRDGVLGGTLNGNTIRLCLTGMVPSLAKERADRFLNSYRPDLMICSGLAGALRPDIHVGDIIVNSEDPDLVLIAERGLKESCVPYHVGPLVTVARPVLTPQARRELASKSRAIAVDMESQTIAALCQPLGIRCVAMKGVSDEMDDDLSPILGGFEIINIPRIALRVLSTPSAWPLAVRLARSSRIAAKNLGLGVWATLQRIA